MPCLLFDLHPAEMGNRQFANFLDQIKRGCAFQRSPGIVSQNAAQEPDIFTKGRSLSFCLASDCALVFEDAAAEGSWIELDMTVLVEC